LPPRSDATAQPSGAPSAPVIANPQHPWRSLLHALLWLVAAEFASFCVAVLIGGVAGLSLGIAHTHGLEGWKPDVLFYGLVATIALQGTLLFADLRQGRSVGYGNLVLGLGAGPMRRHRLIAGFAGLMVAWVLAYVACLIRFQTFDAYVATKVPSILTLPVSAGPVMLAAMLLLAVAVAPVAEELFFRGWLWTALRRSWGVFPTACCTAFLWLGIHAIDGPVRALVLLPTAILLCLARYYGGSVRASLLVHVVNNGTAVIIQSAARILAGS
jgi:uncharacterized protein